MAKTTSYFAYHGVKYTFYKFTLQKSNNGKNAGKKKQYSINNQIFVCVDLDCVGHI